MRKNKTINSFRSSFWAFITALSVIMIPLGILTLGFSFLRLLYGDIWLMWFILAFSGAGTIALALFCLDVFPAWGSIVRQMRLLETRNEGAMSVSEINRYEAREDRRTSEVKDSITESVSHVGKDIVEAKERITGVENKVEKIMQTLATFQQVSSSPAFAKTLESKFTMLQAQLTKNNSIMNSKIDDLRSQIECNSGTKEEKNESIENNATEDITQSDHDNSEEKTGIMPIVVNSLDDILNPKFLNKKKETYEKDNASNGGILSDFQAADSEKEEKDTAKQQNDTQTITLNTKKKIIPKKNQQEEKNDALESSKDKPDTTELPPAEEDDLSNESTTDEEIPLIEEEEEDTVEDDPYLFD